MLLQGRAGDSANGRTSNIEPEQVRESVRLEIAPGFDTFEIFGRRLFRHCPEVFWCALSFRPFFQSEVSKACTPLLAASTYPSF
jgi:hypothetical protein